MKAACPRLFEVEALRDGRLSGAERVRFQSHLDVCAACAHEAQALQAVADALRAPANFTDADELHVRRERTRLLAAFDQSLMPAPRSSRAKLWLGSAAALAVIAVLAGLAFVLGPDRAVPPALESSRDPVTIRADSSARWARHVDDQLDKIVLESGALSIRVAHAVARRRLLVVLPDGELEDIGTTFSVSADSGHTTRVTVQEGSVVLRLHGKPPLVLGAGDSWSPLPAPAAAPIVPATPPPVPTLRDAKPASSTTSATPAPSLATPAPSLATPAPSLATPVPSLATPASDPAADFRDAMSAFNSGDNPRAAARFAAFLARHPLDPRAEDAAYLRILALQRGGSAPATRQAARDYLTRYPRGFRHAEVDTLAR